MIASDEFFETRLEDIHHTIHEMAKQLKLIEHMWLLEDDMQAMRAIAINAYTRHREEQDREFQEYLARRKV